MQDTASLEDAEQATIAVSGASEIDYERTKARSLQLSSNDNPSDPAAALAHLPQIEAAAAERGADFLTIRRIAEILGLPAGGLENLRRHLRPERFPQYLPPLWAVHQVARDILRQIRDA